LNLVSLYMLSFSFFFLSLYNIVTRIEWIKVYLSCRITGRIRMISLSLSHLTVWCIRLEARLLWLGISKLWLVIEVGKKIRLILAIWVPINIVRATPTVALQKQTPYFLFRCSPLLLLV
jgi:hypothetical protein